MSDEEILAAVLLGATGLLFILTVITLCVIVKYVKSKTKRKTSEIPMGKTSHQYSNYAIHYDRNITFNNHNQGIAHTKPDSEPHRAEWPANYNMYAISRSYAFPKTGDTSNHEEQSEGSLKIARQEISHKSFSEEVFEGIKQANHATTSSVTSDETPKNVESQPINLTSNGHGVWKHHTSSETASQHSLDRHSIGTTSTVHSTERQQSYYASFKPRKVSVSSSDKNTEYSYHVRSVSPRQRVPSETASSSGTEKIFSFNIN